MEILVIVAAVLYPVTRSFKFSVRRRKFTRAVTVTPPRTGAGVSGAGRREERESVRERTLRGECLVWRVTYRCH